MNEIMRMEIDEETKAKIRDLLDSCGEIVRQVAETVAEITEAIADAFRQAAGIIDDLIPDIVDAAKEYAKTKPPRNLIRIIGCRPATTCIRKRQYRVQRRM